MNDQNAWWLMGKYGLSVWSVFGLGLLVLLGNIWRANKTLKTANQNAKNLRQVDDR